MINERLNRKWIAQNSDTTSMKLHLNRYNFALSHLQNNKILDIACGTGYGSKILAQQNEVIGVDISADAIDEAIQTAPDLTFICSGYQELILENKIDTIVSLETIEHLPDPEDFIQWCHKILPIDGTLIISAPISYTTDLNSFHLSDFSESSFRNLIERNGFSPTGFHFHQNQKMLESENTSKLTSKEYFQLMKDYLSHPYRIMKRIRDIFINGLNIKYITLIYKKE
jgi:2-polyprenyl-3-methyl-5-hydroxy-6-metoxy-1,4-benzoquinol methylase